MRTLCLCYIIIYLSMSRCSPFKLALAPFSILTLKGTQLYCTIEAGFEIQRACSSSLKQISQLNRNGGFTWSGESCRHHCSCRAYNDNHKSYSRLDTRRPANRPANKQSQSASGLVGETREDAPARGSVWPPTRFGLLASSSTRLKVKVSGII